MFDDGPPIDPAESEGFAYHGVQFTYKGTLREEAWDIQNGFPDSNKKWWLVAQMKLYGIPFKAKDTAAILREKLYSALEQSDKPRDSAVALEKSLKEEYDRRYEGLLEKEFLAQKCPADEAYVDIDRFFAKYFLDGMHGRPAPEKTREPMKIGHARTRSELEGVIAGIENLELFYTLRYGSIIGWKDQMERAVDEEFAKLDSPSNTVHIPSDEAEFDVDRFMAKYFLDGKKGKPAPQKTPEPIELHSYAGKVVEEAAASVPGLIVEKYKGDYVWATVVGWEEEKVRGKIRYLEEKEAAKKARKAAKQEAKKKAREDEIMRPHYEYKKAHQTSTKPLRLDDLAGAYIVKCPEIENEYCPSLYDDPMSLDIGGPHNGLGVQAAFNFGRVIEGRMILALSNDSLEKLREEVSVDPDAESEYEDEGEDIFAERVFGTEPSAPAKRKAPVPSHMTSTSKGRRLGETPQPNRVYFQWAGREGVGESVIQVDEHNEHIGHLDFDASKSFAKGVIAYFREKVDISIFKISDHPRKVPEPWYHFSEKQYSYEEVARWGKR